MADGDGPLGDLKTAVLTAKEQAMDKTIFTGCMPALMTPCNADRSPDFEALVQKGLELIAAGMSAVVYCGSMGDWPLLTDEQRQEGVGRLVEAGVPVVVGTGAVNSACAVEHATHAAEVGAHGLMVIPRVLSRGSSIAAQRAHFASILEAAPDLPAVIYNSPYYGFAPAPICSSNSGRPIPIYWLQGVRRQCGSSLRSRAHHRSR